MTGILYFFPTKEAPEKVEKKLVELISEARQRKLEPEEEDWLNWANTFVDDTNGIK